MFNETVCEEVVTLGKRPDVPKRKVKMGPRTSLMEEVADTPEAPMVIPAEDVVMVITPEGVRYAGVYVAPELPMRRWPEEGVEEEPVPP